jgi:hypothetical protein
MTTRCVRVGVGRSETEGIVVLDVGNTGVRRRVRVADRDDRIGRR